MSPSSIRLGPPWLALSPSVSRTSSLYCRAIYQLCEKSNHYRKRDIIKGYYADRMQPIAPEAEFYMYWDRATDIGPKLPVVQDHIRSFPFSTSGASLLRRHQPVTTTEPHSIGLRRNHAPLHDGPNFVCRLAVQSVSRVGIVYDEAAVQPFEASEFPACGNGSVSEDRNAADWVGFCGSLNTGPRGVHGAGTSINALIFRTFIRVRTDSD
jgi:hypothetical protein